MDLKNGLGRGPFSDQQAEQLDQALSGLDSGQLQWLSGYFSGLLQNVEIHPAQGQQIGTSNKEGQKLTVLYGSHTGNCEALAQNLTSLAKAEGLDAELIDMASFKTRNLKQITNLAVLVSTHGIGEPPVQAEDLFHYLHGKKAPNLSHMSYSVLALGDSSYVDFCKTGKDFDEILDKLGAKRIIPRVDCDVDFEEEARGWQLALLKEITNYPKIRVGLEVKSKGAIQVPEEKYTRNNPFEATILEKIKLNGKGSSKENIHLELSLQGSGLVYEPGDALGVYGANAPSLIENVLKVTQFSGNERVESYQGEKTLVEALTYDYELTPLFKPTLSRYAEITGNSYLKGILSDNKSILTFLYGRDLLDLLQEAPHKLKPQDLLSVLRRNTPRMYSIASAQEAVDEEVHLLVSVVRYYAMGRHKEGHCSSTLADRLMVDDKVKVFVDKNTRFKLPKDPEASIIMVGPGTGIAPFRSFMQQREVMEKKGKSWLFFGDRNFTTDFLYQTEWQQYLKEGVLTQADVAFSRDQTQKQYVQHKMMEKGKDLYDWLEKGAHFYVCGDASQMAKDVDKTLKDIIQQQGGITPEKAAEYIKQLQLSNRYQTDVY